MDEIQMISIEKINNKECEIIIRFPRNRALQIRVTNEEEDGFVARVMDALQMSYKLRYAELQMIENILTGALQIAKRRNKDYV